MSDSTKEKIIKWKQNKSLELAWEILEELYGEIKEEKDE